MDQQQSMSGGNGVVDTARDALSRALPIDDEQLDAVAEQVRDFDRRARTFVREHPTATVLSAVALGFVLGRLLRS
jgi:ElaB/YqjD/DUF883 family membrane-anchored ribosome-binding protein